MKVTNGENIPSKNLRFACYDMFNNRTAPKVGNAWSVSLGSGPLRSVSPTAAVVDAEGIATLHDIRAYVGAGVPMDGLRFVQEVYLSYSDDSNNASWNPNSNLQRSCELKGVVIPGTLPASIAVRHLKITFV
jgi:hypothetical protein